MWRRTSEPLQCFVELILKAVLALSIGAFGLLVGYGNILSPDANWQFVQHVLSMDAFEPWFDPTAFQDRAVTSQSAQTAFYFLIIAGELVAGLLFSIGGMLILNAAIFGNSPSFGKAFVVTGAIAAILVWYTGFAVIGAEWFMMWASQWNGQDKAYTFAIFILLSVLYITREE
ncbi:MAG: DUF2165 domain-containing protein [Hyphomicrobiales bacterium]|nr:DUF2165 domain-containing protein [Hyphomicrobiales bacterium]MCY4052557.1 DUF2165 domain-containing protein [Hyphomicrobiales bacterium]